MSRASAASNNWDIFNFVQRKPLTRLGYWAFTPKNSYNALRRFPIALVSDVAWGQRRTGEWV